jgi:hypothetical protein
VADVRHRQNGTPSRSNPPPNAFEKDFSLGQVLEKLARHDHVKCFSRIDCEHIANNHSVKAFCGSSSHHRIELDPRDLASELFLEERPRGAPPTAHLEDVTAILSQERQYVISNFAVIIDELVAESRNCRFNRKIIAAQYRGQ